MYWTITSKLYHKCWSSINENQKHERPQRIAQNKQLKALFGSYAVALLYNLFRRLRFRKAPSSFLLKNKIKKLHFSFYDFMTSFLEGHARVSRFLPPTRRIIHQSVFFTTTKDIKRLRLIFVFFVQTFMIKLS